MTDQSRDTNHDAVKLEDEIRRIRTTARVISLLGWGVALSIMAYGIPIVYKLLTDTGVPGETAWILSVAVDGALAVGLVATPVLARYGVKGGWIGFLRWAAGIGTWSLNTAEAWMHEGGPDWSGVFTHSVGPLMMFFAVEGAAYFQRAMSDIIAAKQAEARAVDKTQKAEADRRAEEIRKARAEAEVANRKRAEAEANLRAEAEARSAAEAEAQAEVEKRKQAEAEAHAEAEARAEVTRRLTAEVTQHRQAADDAKTAARGARTEAAQQSEIAARTAGQLEESRLLAERAVTAKTNAEQELAAVTESRAAVAAELHRVQQAYARLQQKVEAEGGSNRRKQAEVRGRKQAEVTGSSGRKQMPEIPAATTPGLPPIKGVSPGVVAAVLATAAANPDANQKELADLVGVSDRTVRNVFSRATVAGIGSEINGHSFGTTETTDR